MRKRFVSLRARLLLLVILASVPGLILTVYSAAEQRRHAEEEVIQTALRLVRLATSNQEQLLEGARQLLVALAALPAVQHQDSRGCNSFLEALLAQYPLYANIWVVDALDEPGEIFCSGIPFTGQVNVATAPYYLQTLQARYFTAGEYAQEPIAGSPVLPFGYPVPPEWDYPLAVVFVGIDLDWLGGFVAQAGLPPDSTLSVVDRNGRILARYPDPEILAGSALGSDALQPLLAESEGVFEGVGADGKTKLYAFKVLCCLTSGNVYVRIGIPKETAFAEPDRVLRRNLLALGGVSLFALLAAWFGGNLAVVREMQRLVRTTQHLATGDFRARTGLSQYGGEFGQLAASLDQMAQALEVREAERQQAEADLRLHSARTEALAKIAARLNAELELQSVLSLVCHETASALAVSAASVSLYDESLDLLRIVSYYGLPEGFGQWIEELEWSTCTEPLKAGETVAVADVPDSPELPTATLFGALDIRSFVTTPMMHEGRLVGTLCVFARGQVRNFTEGELAFLRAISDQAAQAIANARLYEVLQEEQRARAELLDKTITAQEDERRRIARELHDQTSQDLAALMLSLDTCALSSAESEPGPVQHLRTAKSIAETMLASVHRLINDLRPSLLDDLGLAPAIAWYGERRLQPLGITLEFQCDQMEARLPPSLETALFRITQEALTNVVKHADASWVHVTLRVEDHTALLTVLDNGMGFEKPVTTPRGDEGQGLGLSGMKERVTILGGELRVESKPGQGTAINVAIPVPQQENHRA